MTRISLQPGYVLHHRPYRETSVLLDVFTRDHGRVSLVAKGVRQQRSRWKGLLQCFAPLLITYQGKSELQTLISAESSGAVMRLQGKCLLSGFYLNELLFRLMPKQDPHPTFYTIYEHTLLELANNTLHEKTIRLFEKKFLDELGYGLSLPSNILTEQFYSFYPDQGFRPYAGSLTSSANVFLGKNLFAWINEQLEDESVLKDAKRLMRLALLPLLGEQPIHARKLFKVNFV